jgi:hypothetical protein
MKTSSGSRNETVTFTVAVSLQGKQQGKQPWKGYSMRTKSESEKLTDFIYEKRRSQYEDLLTCGNSSGFEVPQYQKIRDRIESESKLKSLFEIMQQFGFSYLFCCGYYNVDVKDEEFAQ